jgi:hypothetical protein
MELILNVCWLLLALPAIWVWLRRTPSRNWSGRFSTFGPPVLLGCLLLLLFPIISATDDLQSARLEVEEPGPHRWLKLPVADRLSGPVFKSGNLPMQCNGAVCILQDSSVLGLAFCQPFGIPAEGPRGEMVSRGPPAIQLTA